MKLNDDLSKTLILSQSFLNGISEHEPEPSIKSQDVFEILKKGIPEIREANKTFLIEYKEIVMCLLLILQSKNSDELIIHDTPSKFGENYGYLKIRHKNNNNEPDVLLLSDFYKPLYDNYDDARNFLHKLYSMLKTIHPVFTYTKSENKEIIQTDFPFIVTWKAVREKKENTNMLGGDDKIKAKQKKIKYSDLYNVYEEIELHYNKKLFNILENEHYIFLPDNISKTIKVLEADNIFCYTVGGKKLSITSNNLTKFLLYVQTHKNQYDFVFSENNGNFIYFANEVLPDLLKTENKIPSGIRSKTNFYLYILMFSYAYNKMIESDLLTPNFDFMFGLPIYDTAAEGKILRLPKIPLSGKKISNEEKTLLQSVLKDAQILFSKFCRRLFFITNENNDDDENMELFLNGYLLKNQYFEATVSFFEYLHIAEKMDYSDIAKLSNQDSYDEWCGYRERMNAYSLYVLENKKYRECSLETSKSESGEDFCCYVLMQSCMLGEYTNSYVAKKGEKLNGK